MDRSVVADTFLRWMTVTQVNLEILYVVEGAIAQRAHMVVGLEVNADDVAFEVGSLRVRGSTVTTLVALPRAVTLKRHNSNTM